MANIAEAKGRIYVDDAVYENHHKVFDLLWDELNAGRLDEYGIYVMSKSESEAEFEGAGRWEMQNTIYDVLNSKKDALKQVKKILHEAGGTLTFEYDEYEPGNEILRSVELGFLVREDGSWEITNETVNDYSYDDEIIEELGFTPADEGDF
ncbi:hypothetical protein FC52_GL001782 [Lactobacillus pasteurii DSM 23907 = CRBIP 24.76]|uniref:Uncharacterized protein n=1 Tax=Lactobacillus pasteurii DSM 23907 = CRBIP 24.76 TaxID=1423790 RepID=I7LAK7_9LACO|nr:hypothetical protein [Lactobacillus pasteurii]KRK07509.1 hypothetical protein FC52_GL001782 [Lactobacillus pasteurii DSM 23907 = CRBIP 24.76]TDG77041.1 hypothetical protein C5L33_000684 [Lactobacillus pasteurii]CCI84786.1 Putative uncharacterized protein [Lactobacillus pasteurii DSM 23907 = CRBIP 24.76]